MVALGDPRTMTDDELARSLLPLAEIVATDRGRRRRDDELVADIWWTMFRCARQWTDTGGAKLTTYLYASAKWHRRIARDRAGVFGPAGKAARKHGRPIRHRLADRNTEGVEPAARVEAASIDLREEVARLEPLCEPAHWRVLALTTLDGLAINEAARAVGISRNIAGQRRARAVASIRAGLGACPA